MVAVIKDDGAGTGLPADAELFGRLRHEARAVVQPRQGVETRPSARQHVVLDAPGAELIGPDLDLRGVELDDVRPQEAVGLRTDDAHQPLRTAGERGTHAESLGYTVGFLHAGDRRSRGDPDLELVARDLTGDEPGACRRGGGREGGGNGGGSVVG